MPHRATRTPTRLLLCSLALSGTLLAGCSDDDTNNSGGTPGASVDYVGLVASASGETGPLDITFASPVAAPPISQPAGTAPSLSSGAPVDATGTVSLGGGALASLVGALDGTALLMTGGGWNLTGTIDEGQITGAFSAPGAETGIFVAVSSTDGSPALAFCGSFAGLNYENDPPTEDTGTFSVVVGGTRVLGVAVGAGGEGLPLEGTATSSTITISLSSPEGTLTATGEYDEFGVGGSYEVKVGSFTLSSGSFSGGTCQQPT